MRDNAQLNAFVAGNTALGRAGVPDDIGGVIALLLTPANRWVNAQRIEASGGMFLYCSGPMKYPFPFGLSLSKPFDELRANGSNFTGPYQ